MIYKNIYMSRTWVVDFSASYSYEFTNEYKWINNNLKYFVTFINE